MARSIKEIYNSIYADTKEFALAHMAGGNSYEDLNFKEGMLAKQVVLQLEIIRRLELLEEAIREKS